MADREFAKIVGNASSPTRNWEGGTGLEILASCVGTHSDVLECGMFARGYLPQGQATTIGWDPRTGIAQVH
jgi:hypothetical protein